MTELDRIRTICLDLPNVEERMSHGAPTFFHLKGKSFLMFVGEHHGARNSLWIAARPGAQEALVQSAPESYFRPPYVGTRGGIGVYLDRAVDWNEISDLIEEAYNTTQKVRKS